MCGFDPNRFADLPKKWESDLTCCICLNVYKDALIIGCGHTFCRDCIVLTEQRNQLRTSIKCPECRRPFNTPNHTRASLYRKNRKIDQIVGKLKVKCDFAANGCEDVVELYDLSYHLKHCGFNLCQSCGHLTGDPLKHSCVELLKKDNEQKDKDIEQKSKDLIKLMNELKFLEETRQMPLTLNPRQLLRGFSQPTTHSEPIKTRWGYRNCRVDYNGEDIGEWLTESDPGVPIPATDPDKDVEMLEDTEKPKDPEEPNDLSKDD